jgi:hypothetical protein
MRFVVLPSASVNPAARTAGIHLGLPVVQVEVSAAGGRRAAVCLGVATWRRARRAPGRLAAPGAAPTPGSCLSFSWPRT